MFFLNTERGDTGYFSLYTWSVLGGGKAIADGLVGQILAGPLFLKVKTKFHFTESK